MQKLHRSDAVAADFLEKAPCVRARGSGSFGKLLADFQIVREQIVEDRVNLAPRYVASLKGRESETGNRFSQSSHEPA